MVSMPGLSFSSSYTARMFSTRSWVMHAKCFEGEKRKRGEIFGESVESSETSRGEDAGSECAV